MRQAQGEEVSKGPIYIESNERLLSQRGWVLALRINKKKN